MTGETEFEKPRHSEAMRLVVRSFAGLLERMTGSGIDDWTAEETEAVASSFEVLGKPAAAARLREYRSRWTQERPPTPLLVIEQLAALLKESLNTPFFEKREDWDTWCREFRAKVERALGKAPSGGKATST